MRSLLLLTLVFLPALVFAQATAGPPPSVVVDTTDETRVFERVEIEAAFPGGVTAWRKYLEKNLKPTTPIDNGAPSGSYTVWAQFLVDKDGSISDAKALTQLGYGMEEEVLRIIKKGPRWVPAIQNGKTVKAYRKQPVTFVVSDDSFVIQTKTPYTLYSNTDNEIIVEATKVKPEELVLHISSGSINQVAPGKFMVRIPKPGRVIINVFKKNKEIGSASFEVRAPN